MPDSPLPSPQRADPPGKTTVATAGSTRIAVMGDLHFYRLWVRPWHLLNKRILGQINLWWDRRHSFDRTLLAPMLQRVLAIDPALLLLTGDLTMTALRDEFEDVRCELGALGGKFPVIGVPGNHDRYTPFSRRRRIMETCLPGLIPDTFPHVRSVTPRWQLMVLDAAMPRLLSARGVVGAMQIAKATQYVRSLSADQGLIVMCHYPAIPRPDGRRTGWNHRLADAPAVRDMLRQCKAQIIYVHGHVHWPWLVRQPEGIANMIDLNVGAPIMRKAEYANGQGFWELDLPDDPSDKVTFTHHVPKATVVNKALISLEARKLVWDTRVVQ